MVSPHAINQHDDFPFPFCGVLFHSKLIGVLYRSKLIGAEQG